MSYLCGMLYLKTPTSDLSVRQIRSVVCETIRWCETNLGTKPSRQGSLKFKVISGNVPAYGTYDYRNNTIIIYRNHTSDVKMVVRTVLHEYAHFLQNLRYYNLVLSRVGHTNHPQEKEASVMEDLYSQCWGDIRMKL